MRSLRKLGDDRKIYDASMSEDEEEEEYKTVRVQSR
jgi:hypothetical protein